MIKRKPFAFRRSLILCSIKSSRKQNAISIGEKRIDKELDIVNFIKLQKVLRMALGVLFTRDELTLVKNNKYLTLRKRYDKVEHTSS